MISFKIFDFSFHLAKNFSLSYYYIYIIHWCGNGWYTPYIYIPNLLSIYLIYFLVSSIRNNKFLNLHWKLYSLSNYIFGDYIWPRCQNTSSVFPRVMFYSYNPWLTSHKFIQECPELIDVQEVLISDNNAWKCKNQITNILGMKSYLPTTNITMLLLMSYFNNSGKAHCIHERVSFNVNSRNTQRCQRIVYKNTNTEAIHFYWKYRWKGESKVNTKASDCKIGHIIMHHSEFILEKHLAIMIKNSMIKERKVRGSISILYRNTNNTDCFAYLSTNFLDGGFSPSVHCWWNHRRNILTRRSPQKMYWFHQKQRTSTSVWMNDYAEERKRIIALNAWIVITTRFGQCCMRAI